MLSDGVRAQIRPARPRLSQGLRSQRQNASSGRPGAFPPLLFVPPSLSPEPLPAGSPPLSSGQQMRLDSGVTLCASHSIQQRKSRALYFNMPATWATSTDGPAFIPPSRRPAPSAAPLPTPPATNPATSSNGVLLGTLGLLLTGGCLLALLSCRTFYFYFRGLNAQLKATGDRFATGGGTASDTPQRTPAFASPAFQSSLSSSAARRGRPVASKVQPGRGERDRAEVGNAVGSRGRRRLTGRASRRSRLVGRMRGSGSVKDRTILRCGGPPRSRRNASVWVRPAWARSTSLTKVPRSCAESSVRRSRRLVRLSVHATLLKRSGW